MKACIYATTPEGGTNTIRFLSVSIFYSLVLFEDLINKIPFSIISTFTLKNME